MGFGGGMTPVPPPPAQPLSGKKLYYRLCLVNLSTSGEGKINQIKQTHPSRKLNAILAFSYIFYKS